MSSDRSHSPSNAERFLPIKLPRSLRGEERETDKENGSKYSKISRHAESSAALLR